MKEQMTVHKALAELKLLDARIEKEVEALECVVANKHNNAKISGISIEDFSDRARSAYQSITTLINRRNAIKRGVTRSNAVTMVNIGGKSYSVAEAIDMKATGIKYLASLKNKLLQQLIQAKHTADRENERLDSRADDYVKSLYQGSDMKNMADEVKKVRDTFVTAQTMEIIDPIHAESEAIRLQNELEAFMADVDSTLSVSNALTTIEVEYETK